jgi:hypothetical protein
MAQCRIRPNAWVITGLVIHNHPARTVDETDRYKTVDRHETSSVT